MNYKKCISQGELPSIHYPIQTSYLSMVMHKDRSLLDTDVAELSLLLQQSCACYLTQLFHFIMCDLWFSLRGQVHLPQVILSQQCTKYSSMTNSPLLHLYMAGDRSHLPCIGLMTDRWFAGYLYCSVRLWSHQKFFWAPM